MRRGRDGEDRGRGRRDLRDGGGADAGARRPRGRVLDRDEAPVPDDRRRLRGGRGQRRSVGQFRIAHLMLPAGHGVLAPSSPTSSTRLHEAGGHDVQHRRRASPPIPRRHRSEDDAASAPHRPAPDDRVGAGHDARRGARRRRPARRPSRGLLRGPSPPTACPTSRASGSPTARRSPPTSWSTPPVAAPRRSTGWPRSGAAPARGVRGHRLHVHRTVLPLRRRRGARTCPRRA